MDEEKMNARELTEKELAQVSGGICPPNITINCPYKNNKPACPTYSSCPLKKTT